ncbi:hypothetical protein BRC90_01425 [Halobacteriales archaeon QS_4_69_34]|nr:MAG: hypothetical protein BRC90_01425 [Halobacteriales archaeon QS_4_69_34]
MRLHPLSAALRGLSRGLSVGTALFFLGTAVGAIDPPGGVLAGPLLGLVGFALGVGWELLYYRRFDYELTADTLDIASGVLSRRDREIPLRRVQNVDISRGLLQRTLDVAAVEIETAGGGDTEASLRYVSYEEAKRLQRDVGRRKRGHTGDAGATGDRTGQIESTGEAGTGETATSAVASGAAETGETMRPAAGEDDERAAAEGARPTTDERSELFALGTRNLLVLGLVAPDLRALLPVLFFAAPVVGLSIPDLLLDSGVLAVGPRGAALAAVSWAGSAAVTAARYYDFRLTRVGDELRYERGLLSRYDGSIPLEKIQQLDFRENVLMRRAGYAGLAVETAGYAPGGGPAGGSEAAIPLAGRREVRRLARSIEGFAAADLERASFVRPPERARRRYAVRYLLALALAAGVLYAVNALLGGVGAGVGGALGGVGGVGDAGALGVRSLLGYWYAPLALVPVALVAAHLKWVNRGYSLGSAHVLTRNGFWRRTTSVVPYCRVQTVIESRTLFQRWRRLATVAIDTAGSSSLVRRGARAVDADSEEAATLRETVRKRLRTTLAVHRHSATPGRAGDG